MKNVNFIHKLHLYQTFHNFVSILGSPNLVILDEPCSGVDAKARKKIWQLISDLRKGRAVILATHYLDEAEHLSDNVLILNDVSVCTY